MEHEKKAVAERALGASDRLQPLVGGFEAVAVAAVPLALVFEFLDDLGFALARNCGLPSLAANLAISLSSRPISFAEPRLLPPEIDDLAERQEQGVALNDRFDAALAEPCLLRSARPERAAGCARDVDSYLAFIATCFQKSGTRAAGGTFISARTARIAEIAATTQSISATAVFQSEPATIPATARRSACRRPRRPDCATVPR